MSFNQTIRKKVQPRKRQEVDISANSLNHQQNLACLANLCATLLQDLGTAQAAKKGTTDSLQTGYHLPRTPFRKIFILLIQKPDRIRRVTFKNGSSPSFLPHGSIDSLAAIISTTANCFNSDHHFFFFYFKHTLWCG